MESVVQAAAVAAAIAVPAAIAVTMVLSIVLLFQIHEIKTSETVGILSSVHLLETSLKQTPLLIAMLFCDKFFKLPFHFEVFSLFNGFFSSSYKLVLRYQVLNKISIISEKWTVVTFPL